MSLNHPSGLVPDEVQRLSAVVHYDDFAERVLGELPLQHMRLQLGGLMRISPKARTVTLFVLRELGEAGRALHWSDLFRAWAAHERQRGRQPCDADAFWGYLVPALATGVLVADWEHKRVLVG